MENSKCFVHLLFESFPYRHDPNAKYKVAGEEEADGDGVGPDVVHVRLRLHHEGALQQTLVDWRLDKMLSTS